jgi:hypothetical protein
VNKPASCGLFSCERKPAAIVIASAPTIYRQKEALVSFVFRLVSDDAGHAPAVVFEDSTSPGFVPLWAEVGVYDALYNSDGRPARDVSRAIAFGMDRLVEDASLGRLVPASLSFGEAIRFLENLHRGCTIHASAHIETR